MNSQRIIMGMIATEAAEMVDTTPRPPRERLGDEEYAAEYGIPALVARVRRETIEELRGCSVDMVSQVVE